jgi:hypothetical protein
MSLSLYMSLNNVACLVIRRHSAYLICCHNYVSPRVCVPPVTPGAPATANVSSRLWRGFAGESEKVVFATTRRKTKPDLRSWLNRSVR